MADQMQMIPRVGAGPPDGAPDLCSESVFYIDIGVDGVIKNLYVWTGSAYVQVSGKDPDAAPPQKLCPGIGVVITPYTGTSACGDTCTHVISATGTTLEVASCAETRPPLATAGQLQFNFDCAGQLEMYDGCAWVYPQGLACGMRIHCVDSNKTFVLVSQDADGANQLWSEIL